MSASYFVQNNIDLTGITQLGLDMFVPQGSACGGGSPRIQFELEDLEFSSDLDKQANQFVYAHWNGACVPEQWLDLDFIADSTTFWEAPAVGGAATGPRLAAMQAAANHFGAYRISAIRLQFDSGGNEAWFDNFAINEAVLAERIQDMQANALLPDIDMTAEPTLGFFESRNVRWNVAPRPFKDPGMGEAMEFSPATRTEQIDFMSTSFFPQVNLQVADLDRLQFTVLYDQGSVCGAGSPRFVLLLKNAAGITQHAVGRWDSGACQSDRWHVVDFVDGTDTSWSFGGATGLSLTQLHDHASSWSPDYFIDILRINADDVGQSMWLDNEYVNEAALSERFQDFSLESQTPPAALGDGFTGLIRFPQSDVTVAGDGAVILVPDANNKIVVTVTPFFDGREQADGSWGERTGNYAVDPEYDQPGGQHNGYEGILNVAFFDHITGNHLYVGRLPDQPFRHVRNGQYRAALKLPSGFLGGVYTVVLNDNYPDCGPGTGADNSDDNRGSYFFLPKDLLLSASGSAPGVGGARFAPVADALDTPSALVGPDPITGTMRGYEGPRTPVVIMPTTN